MSWLSKLKQGLSKTASLFTHVEDLDTWEEALLQADVGYGITSSLLDGIRSRKPQSNKEVQFFLSELLVQKMKPVAQELRIDSNKKPFVILMVGVNGAGKTTTIGKLGQFYQNQGKQVTFVAADTFRAGATEQLCRWGEKLGCTVYTASAKADAAGLVYDSIQKSKQAGDDILFIDTAGRLQNRSDLMDELKKIKRVIQKQDATAPHATILVLDATVGQNAISQVQHFQEIIALSGLIMTKLDGTAKGGILIPLAEQFKLPIYAIGVGEQIDDLHSFTAEDYVRSLLGEDIWK